MENLTESERALIGLVRWAQKTKVDLLIVAGRIMDVPLEQRCIRMVDAGLLTMDAVRACTEVAA